VTLTCLALPSDKSAGVEYPWSKTVSELEKSNMINIIPYEVHLDYDYWDYRKSTTPIQLRTY
jgi:tRNA (guanine37-N1)-methyltransferase